MPEGKGWQWPRCSDLLQVLRAKGERQQLLQPLDNVGAISFGQVDIPVCAKLSHHLSAGTAGRDEVVPHVTGDGHGLEAGVPLGDGFLDGAALGAHPQAVAGILHVAPREDLSAGSEQRSSHREAAAGFASKSCCWVAAEEPQQAGKRRPNWQWLLMGLKLWELFVVLVPEAII